MPLSAELQLSHDGEIHPGLQPTLIRVHYFGPLSQEAKVLKQPLTSNPVKTKIGLEDNVPFKKRNRSDPTSTSKCVVLNQLL